MVTVYTTPSCSSCKKAKQWLKENNIDFKEFKLFNTKITKKDIYEMLKNTENGFEDIISLRSKVISNLNKDIEDFTTNEMCDFIIDNPSCLRRPIILDSSNMQVGYNEDDIDAFLPIDIKKQIVCNDCDNKDSDSCNYNRALEESVISDKLFVIEDN